MNGSFRVLLEELRSIITEQKNTGLTREVARRLLIFAQALMFSMSMIDPRELTEEDGEDLKELLFENDKLKSLCEQAEKKMKEVPKKSKEGKLGSVWYSCNEGCIGIVMMHNGYEKKAYIGIVEGKDQEQDEKYILSHGTPFPVKQAQEMIGVII